MNPNRLDAGEARRRLSVFKAELRAFAEERSGEWGPYFILVYGSYAYGVVHEGSDLNAMLVAEHPDGACRAEFARLIQGLHQRFGMPYRSGSVQESTLVVPLRFLRRACGGDGLWEGNRPRLGRRDAGSTGDIADGARLRFLAGTMLHRHVFVDGDVESYSACRERAADEVIRCLAAAAPARLSDETALMGALCELEGRSGPSHLGFLPEEPYLGHLAANVARFAARSRVPRIPPARRAGQARGKAAIPLFVLGSPRSGTTLLGELLGSHPDVANLEEISALYFAEHSARTAFRRVPTPVRDEYLASLVEHAVRFVDRVSARTGQRYFCDATPWNLRIVDFLADRYPEAVFILNVRNYPGVVQSLRRSYADGWLWAGPTDRERALLWSDLYERSALLPAERVIPFSYDALCHAPARAVEYLRSALAAKGVPAGELDLRVLARSHATVEPRPTLATGGPASRLRSIEPYSRESWTGEDEGRVGTLTARVAAMLNQRYPGICGDGEGFRYEPLPAASPLLAASAP